ncbi:hypothetical protein EXIGLDRAFT_782395 [Exidia glandulosa HHB12029]|uniref:Uncharacterized protein n=1 Tax=Exidia glandulosa HHB12029 TaxID=1314781 RepID=A0A165AU69_EXIGL|nr:hypothetical protein EXIGLDRAFT_782395 [Exidia glandulosa HHB12029]
MARHAHLFLHFFLIGLILHHNLCNARQVKVDVGDAPNGIVYERPWSETIAYRVRLDDAPGGKPNSSVCAFGDNSRYVLGDASFSFSFTGVAVQLVMASRPDHWQFTVSTDSGPPTLGNTWSIAPSCGVTYSKSNLAFGTHAVNVSSKPNGGTRSFLELLSIIYDDGTDPDPDHPDLSSTASSSSASPTPPFPTSLPSAPSNTTSPPSELPFTSKSTPSPTAASGLSRRAMIVMIAVLAALLGAATIAFVGYLTSRSCRRRRLQADHVHPFHVQVDGGALPPPSPKHKVMGLPRATVKSHGPLLTTGGNDARPLSRDDIERIAVRVQDVLSVSVEAPPLY